MQNLGTCFLSDVLGAIKKDRHLPLASRLIIGDVYNIGGNVWVLRPNIPLHSHWRIVVNNPTSDGYLDTLFLRYNADLKLDKTGDNTPRLSIRANTQEDWPTELITNKLSWQLMEPGDFTH